MSKNDNNTYKVLFVGPCLSGKTLLLKHLCGSKENNTSPTICVSINGIRWKCDGQEITIKVWDTSGVEQLQDLTMLYYRGCDAVIYFFDPTSRDDFESMLRFFEISKNYASSDHPFKKVLLGHYFRTWGKIAYEVPRSESISAAFLFGATYLELFEHSEANLAQFLDSIAELLMQNNSEPPRISLSPPPIQLTGIRRFFRK